MRIGASFDDALSGKASKMISVRPVGRIRALEIP
jgi:hypothetical protein